MPLSPALRNTAAAALLAGLAAVPVLLSAGPAASQTGTEAAWEPGRPTACRFGAWTRNETAAPIVVRAGPSAAAPVIGHLPTTGADGSTTYEYSVTFDVTAVNGEWLEITNVSDSNNADDQRAARPVPVGTGWIRSDAVRLGVQSARGYQRPDTASRRLIDLGTEWLTGMGRVTRVIACDGDWILADYAIVQRWGEGNSLIEISPAEQQHGRAWFHGLCGIEETTCDMRSVDQ